MYFCLAWVFCIDGLLVTVMRYYISILPQQHKPKTTHTLQSFPMIKLHQCHSCTQFGPRVSFKNCNYVFWWMLYILSTMDPCQTKRYMHVCNIFIFFLFQKKGKGKYNITADILHYWMPTDKMCNIGISNFSVYKVKWSKVLYFWS